MLSHKYNMLSLLKNLFLYIFMYYFILRKKFKNKNFLRIEKEQTAKN